VEVLLGEAGALGLGALRMVQAAPAPITEGAEEAPNMMAFPGRAAGEGAEGVAEEVWQEGDGAALPVLVLLVVVATLSLLSLLPPLLRLLLLRRP
jgi:hypothetical protein